MGPRPPVEQHKRTRKTQRDGHNRGVKILQFIFGLQLPLTCNPWTTLSNPCNKERSKILLKKSSCAFLHASFLPASLSLRLFNYGVVVMLHEHVYENITKSPLGYYHESIRLLQLSLFMQWRGTALRLKFLESSFFLHPAWRHEYSWKKWNYTVLKPHFPLKMSWDMYKYICPTTTATTPPGFSVLVITCVQLQNELLPLIYTFI